jgi:hypothetical protein
MGAKMFQDYVTDDGLVQFTVLFSALAFHNLVYGTSFIFKVISCVCPGQLGGLGILGRHMNFRLFYEKHRSRMWPPNSVLYNE